MSKIVMKMAEESSTLGSKLDEYFIAKKIDGLCEKSIKTYKGKLEVCFSHVNFETNLENINWSDIIQSIHTRNISEASKNSYLASLRNFMKWLDIGLQLPKVKKIDTIKECYTNDELRLLLKKPGITSGYTTWRTYAIEMLVCDTGIRAGSVRNIKIKDVDFDNCLLYLRHTKTNKVQVLPFSKATQNALKRIQNAHIQAKGYSEDKYLFSDVYGLKMSENSLRLSIARYNRKHGVNKTSIHAFRHTFAKRWLTECGGNVITLKSMLGHSRLEMSEHYARLYDNQLKELYVSPVELLSRKQLTIH